MIEATKTGNPQEIAEGLRRIADDLEKLPPFIQIKLYYRVDILPVEKGSKK